MARKGMTMYQLARRSAIPHSTLSSILNGQTKNTGFLNIINICRGLEITLQDFSILIFSLPKIYWIIEAKNPASFAAPYFRYLLTNASEDGNMGVL